MNKRVLLITNIPNPYRIPLFNELNYQLNEKNDKLYVAFAGTGYARRKWNNNLEQARFEYTILRSTKITLGSSEKILFTYGGIFAQIKKVAPDVIIVAGFSIATLKLYIYSFFKNIRFIIWSGSINTKGRQDTILRKFYRTIIAKRAHGFIAYGSLAKKYLIDIGADPEKISIAINTVDTEFFRIETEKLREEIKRESKFYLTYIGELNKRKNVKQLLEVIKLLTEVRQDFILEIIGDGPEKLNLINYVTQNNLDQVVKFYGYKQKEHLPVFLARSSLFLFQTQFDIWGLVLVEAMAAGIPCLASNNAGSTNDLIIDGFNGYKVDFEDKGAVLNILNDILTRKINIQEIGKNSSKFIAENANLKRSSNGFINAISKL